LQFGNAVTGLLPTQELIEYVDDCAEMIGIKTMVASFENMASLGKNYVGGFDFE
jgi:hypothetical protein